MILITSSHQNRRHGCLHSWRRDLGWTALTRAGNVNNNVDISTVPGPSKLGLTHIHVNSGDHNNHNDPHKVPRHPVNQVPGNLCGLGNWVVCVPEVRLNLV